MPVPQVGEDVTALMPEVGADVTSLMGEPPPKTEGRTWTDTAVDALPIVGGLIGSIVSAPTGPGAIGGAAIGAAGGEAWRQNLNRLRGKDAPDSMAEAATGIATEGALSGAGQAVGLGAVKGARALGKVAMRGAMGAQTALRRKFPTVDLEKIALREGVGLPGANVAGKVTEAHRAVGDAGRAADAAGAAKIQPREMIAKLRPLYDRAAQTRMAGDKRQIVDAANDVRKTYRGGLSVEDALATKSEMGSQASSVMQGAADPRAAGTAKKVLGALSRATGDAARSRTPDVAQALTKSQEMMALDRALKSSSGPSQLRLLIGAGAGVGSGVSSGDPLQGVAGALGTLAMTSPRGLSLLAQLLTKGAPAAKGTTRTLAQLMSSHEEP